MQTGINRIASEIDAIDEELVALLKQRFDRSRRIGALKQDAGMPSHNPARVAGQTRRFVDLCVGRGLDERMGASIIESIIAQVLIERKQ